MDRFGERGTQSDFLARTDLSAASADGPFRARTPTAYRCGKWVRIEVAGQPMEVVVPSSLFRYVHGTADPYHPQRVQTSPW